MEEEGVWGGVGGGGGDPDEKLAKGEQSSLITIIGSCCWKIWNGPVPAWEGSTFAPRRVCVFRRKGRKKQELAEDEDRKRLPEDKFLVLISSSEERAATRRGGGRREPRQ